MRETAIFQSERKKKKICTRRKSLICLNKFRHFFPRCTRHRDESAKFRRKHISAPRRRRRVYSFSCFVAEAPWHLYSSFYHRRDSTRKFYVSKRTVERLLCHINNRKKMKENSIIKITFESSCQILGYSFHRKP